MKHIALLLFLHVSPAFGTKECVRDLPVETMWENKLHEKLMCNYNSELPPRPLNNTDSVDITLRFIFKQLHYLSEAQVFSAYMWTFIAWRDERLKWNASEFDGIDETAMSNFKLWLPGIKLMNGVDDLYDQRYEYVPCKVKSIGETQCFSWIQFEATCTTDLSDWPFDTQVCSLQFGPWSTQGVKIRLDIPPKAVIFIDSEFGAEWDMIDYTQEEDQDAQIQLKLNFTMARHGDILGAMIVPPSVLLSVLTISALFIDARSGRRLFVVCFSLASHFYFLSELGMNIPRHSKNSPRILLFFRGSVIMTIISVTLTFLLKVLYKREAPLPNFITIANQYVYKSYVKFIIFPKLGFRDDDEREPMKVWTAFSNILNSAWIYISLLVYIIMFCVLVPTPSGLRTNIYHRAYDFQ